MLTGKDIAQAIEHTKIERSSMDAYEELARLLNTAHITPLQGLVQELEGLVDWDNFTEAYEEDTLKRIKQLCGGQS